MEIFMVVIVTRKSSWPVQYICRSSALQNSLRWAFSIPYLAETDNLIIAECDDMMSETNRQTYVVRMNRGVY
jgi:hypothetical protein